MDEIIACFLGWLCYVGLISHNTFLLFHDARQMCYYSLQKSNVFYFFTGMLIHFGSGLGDYETICLLLTRKKKRKPDEKHWNVIDQRRNKMTNLDSRMFLPHVSISLGWSVYPDSSLPGHRDHPAGMINALLCCTGRGCLSAVSFSFPVLLPDISLMWLDNEEIDSDHYAARKE